MRHRELGRKRQPETVALYGVQCTYADRATLARKFGNDSIPINQQVAMALGPVQYHVIYWGNITTIQSSRAIYMQHSAQPSLLVTEHPDSTAWLNQH
ncbi:hypothetical protein N3K66_006330 [Trichothecium roseum]|uniref:Uncharacterized protein n=1 Tax=Trichothecium roseum TaxID=47278 RepID=A0ACC0UWR1_9HYPO|nr:hypothetical protein N3K66_006330 [Trichothecium roseum]